MAAATCVVPIKVYLRSEYEPAAEYVDGVIEERPTGNGITHPGSMQYKFIDGNLAPESHFGVPGDRIHFAIGEIEAFLS